MTQIPNDTRARTLASATDYMRDHFREDIRLSDVAAAAGVVPRTLQIVIQDRLNLTPKELLTKMRLRGARHDLLAADDRTNVTFVAFNNGFGHIGRFSQCYRQEFGESPSETLASARACNKAPHRPTSMAFRATRGTPTGRPHVPPDLTPEAKAATSIEATRQFSSNPDFHQACETVHSVLRTRLGYKRGAVILKRHSDERPFLFSHCRGDLDETAFSADVERVNRVMLSARGIVHSVLQTGYPRIENDLSLSVDYAALDATIRSEICVPVIAAGNCIGAVNVESDRQGAFDVHDEALINALATTLAGPLNEARSNACLGLTESV